MATPGANIQDRIIDLIGSDFATVPNLSYKDLVNAAFNQVVDMVYEDLLLKYSRTPGRLEGDTEWLVEDRKILKVTRVDSNSNGVERDCEYVDKQGFSESQDSNSIYQATVFSPVYHLDSKNDGAATLKIFPVCNASGQEGRIWYFSYANDSTNLMSITASTLNTSYYLPGSLIHAIVLKSCINILNAYISNFVQDDEDMELQQMIEKQSAKLTQDFMAEITRYSDQEKQAIGGSE